MITCFVYIGSHADIFLQVSNLSDAPPTRIDREKKFIDYYGFFCKWCRLNAIMSCEKAYETLMEIRICSLFLNLSCSFKSKAHVLNSLAKFKQFKNCLHFVIYKLEMGGFQTAHFHVFPFLVFLRLAIFYCLGHILTAIFSISIVSVT